MLRVLLNSDEIGCPHLPLAILGEPPIRSRPWHSRIHSPGDLGLRSWVNGEPRQDSTHANLIFDVNYVIWHLSQFLALEPGAPVTASVREICGTGISPPCGQATSGR
ncbi:MAG: fumarylacetoacetate hydrolase family protein [Candidatus Saccharibacteria bacterium]|nr:fumarylacetoacetate hydrolase family protein [Microbacteriaceae bacterium]